MPGRGRAIRSKPTALVNEAWLKLRGHFDGAEPSPAFFPHRRGGDAPGAHRSRPPQKTHQARRRRATRRDVAELADSGSATSRSDFDEVLRLNDALTRLEALDPQAAEVVKLRFFTGLTVEQTAAAIGIGERTVKRDWQFARAWLAKSLAALCNSA